MSLSSRRHKLSSSHGWKATVSQHGGQTHFSAMHLQLASQFQHVSANTISQQTGNRSDSDFTIRLSVQPKPKECKTVRLFVLEDELEGFHSSPHRGDESRKSPANRLDVASCREKSVCALPLLVKPKSIQMFPWKILQQWFKCEWRQFQYYEWNSFFFFFKPAFQKAHLTPFHTPLSRCSSLIGCSSEERKTCSLIQKPARITKIKRATGSCGRVKTGTTTNREWTVKWCKSFEGESTWIVHCEKDGRDLTYILKITAPSPHHLASGAVRGVGNLNPHRPKTSPDFLL